MRLMPKSVLTPYPKDTPDQQALPVPKSVSLPATPRVSPVLDEDSDLAAETVEHYAMDDVASLRNGIFNKVQRVVGSRFPIENARYKFELADVKYDSDKPFSKKEQKAALLKQVSLNRRLKGKWRMVDKASGNVVDEQDMVLAHVPYLTERGTFIKNGNEYGVANQSRLKAGAYNRRRNNGEAETHFNILDGGRGWHLVMDPATKQFTIQVGGAKLKLFPILRDMGLSDRQLMDTWGKEVYEDNISTDDSPKRARKQFGRSGDEDVPLADIFAKMQLDPEVTARTLGNPYTNVTPEAILASTKRLIGINRNEEPEDDRDSIAYQKIMSPDELFAERIALDYDKQTRKMMWRSTNKGKLSVDSGHFTRQLDSIFNKSGLAQALEETNLIENLDQMYKVLRTGEAGISSDGVPVESRNVQGSHLGIIDPVRGPESGSVGLDSRFSINARRGSDGRVYSMMTNSEGKEVPVSAQRAANSTIAFPGELQSESKRVRVMSSGGNIRYVDRGDVDFWMKDSSHMFSVGSNLVPMISSTLGPRLLMGGKFYNQALPIKDPEAPLVQSLTDDGESSFEELYGTKVGALRSEVAGRVVKVTDDEVHIKTPKGIEKVELYNNFPLNRKTTLHNTPQVKPGDTVKPGDLIASSNVTDAKGTLALGKNLSVAYMPWQGMNTDDAVVISESAAKRMSSEHLFSKKIDNEDAIQRDRSGFVSLYPSKYNKTQLANIGPDGVIRPGMVVQKGDPLILAVKERRVSDIHRGQKPGFIDSSEEWDHEAPGFVTDVAQTNKGVRLTVKAYQPMQVGDKLVGRFGDKGVISKVVPDGEMPVREDDTPIDVILNPVGVVSRCYDDETEFLTREGWKFGEDVTDSDELMNYDPDTETVFFAPQEDKFHRAHYEGDMLEYEDAALSCCVTPNHTFWAKAAHSSTFKSVTASQLSKGTYTVPALAQYNDGNQSYDMLGTNWKREHYDGYIYCGTTSTGYMITRRRGSVLIAGNTNPSQLVEAILGKIADKTGKPYKIPGFMKGSNVEFAINELKKHGLSDVGSLRDPSSKRKFNDIMTGKRFMMKLHHMAEDKSDARSYGGYTSEDQPVRGGGGGAKQMGMLGINALLSHSATEVIKDAKTIRGQRNNDYWKAFQQGYAPPSPDIPFVYKKFRAHLIGAGININKKGHQENLMALTDKDVMDMSSGEIKLPKGVDIEDMKEIEGGLFDKRVTGGHGGSKWSHIKLNEPMPNPVMEEPIRRLLGLTQSKYEDVLYGKEKLHERTGGEAILEALKRVDLKRLKLLQEETIRSGAKSKRDNAVKLLKYINGFEKTGVAPRDLVMHNVPVLPPAFRPISSTEKFTIVADPNKLYVDLMKANEALDEVRTELGDSQAGQERLNLYNSFKAVTGLGDPISPKLKQQKVSGLLAHVFGSGSPKYGMFQRRVLGGSVDFSGRAVISPNPSLDMDTVGLPEEQAWDLYKPMVMRRMTRRGMPPTIALKAILDRNEAARRALVEEMGERPVIINRAPTLHKYNTMAVFPQLVKGHTLQVSPVIASGFNADYDGDAMQIHVPVSEKAVEEARDKMLPSKNLLSASKFKAHYLPEQEFQHGLWIASARESKDEPVTFATVEDAMAAYKNGELNIDDRIRIAKIPVKKRSTD
jgi:DNA-directed RNA polymerase beta subunit